MEGSYKMVLSRYCRETTLMKSQQRGCLHKTRIIPALIISQNKWKKSQGPLPKMKSSKQLSTAEKMRFSLPQEGGS